MSQNFNSIASPEQGPPRLKLLRKWLETQKLDGFIVPRADCHQGENVAAYDERLSWLTGFTGSAGFACVLNSIAAVFVDSRYRLQVLDQVASAFTPVNWPETQLPEWLKTHLSPNSVVGYDPWLHTVDQINNLKAALVSSNISLKSCENGIDTLWTDRPSTSKEPAWEHPLKFSGEDSKSKVNKISYKIEKMSADAAIFTLPDSICWLLNLRGADVAHTPIVHCFAIVTKKGHITVFGDKSKLGILVHNPKVTLSNWNDFEEYLTNFTGKIIIDTNSLPQAAMDFLLQGAGEVIPKDEDLCNILKACKNSVEIEGSRQAHLRDGAAMVSFLAWFEQADLSELDEIEVVKVLENYRKNTEFFYDISFDTISGSGPNGAINHYRVTHETNRQLDSDSLLLIDSGAQYFDGTTDVTRTLPLGQPSLEMKQAFTRVLQGMIAISRVRFPRGLTGRDIDPLARMSLWAVGQDYDHGTGHGVGSFLSVHEGPQRISRLTDVVLQEGMILSNEPGYYKPDSFGIRIENLVVVKPAPELINGDLRDMWSFETLTMVPINKTMIEINLLTKEEIIWINSYHKTVETRLNPLLDTATQKWLGNATSPI